MAGKNEKELDVMERDFPEVKEVTLEMQEALFRQGRLVRGSVRLMLGRLSTTEELEERRRVARNKPLS
jgi:hypothetical protein